MLISIRTYGGNDMIRKIIISRNKEPELKEKNTVYLQITDEYSKEDLLRVANRMMADEIIIQEEITTVQSTAVNFGAKDLERYGYKK